MLLSVLLVLAAVTHALFFYRRESQSVFPQPPRLLSGALPAYVLTHSTTSQYHDSIVKLEEAGSDFCFVQYRIAPYFLPPTAVEHVADLRFGAANPLGEKYIAAQNKRRAAFQRLMTRGAQVREIYPRSRLLSYVRTGTHLGEMWPLTPDLMVELLNGWRMAIASFDNYTVAIADESVPMKYHLIDRNAVVLHEPIGRGDAIRLNSVFVLDSEIGSRFGEDFDLVWGLIDPTWRDPKNIVRWIEHDLIREARVREKNEHHAQRGRDERR